MRELDLRGLTCATPTGAGAGNPYACYPGNHDACVLVVDDADALRDAVVEAITDAGYTVEQAENGREALTKMRASRPCLVLLDLMMPMMDGWEVVSEMDADPKLASVPVCIVSAQTGIAPPRNVGVLKKPASLAGLLRAVETHCGKPSLG